MVSALAEPLKISRIESRRTTKNRMGIFISEPENPSNPYLSRIKLIKGDITQQNTDAIVSVIPQDLEYRGEINSAILRGAGQKLDEFVLEHIYRPRPADIYAVPGFNLPCKHIFFCVLPAWRSDLDRDDRHLVAVCRKAMEMARALCLKSIAFPPLAAGKHGYPKQKAARLMVQGIAERLDESLDEVRIVSPAGEALKFFAERLAAVGWKE